MLVKDNFSFCVNCNSSNWKITAQFVSDCNLREKKKVIDENVDFFAGFSEKISN